jgi:hypothetical protein
MATSPNAVELVDLRDLTVQQRNAIDMLVTGCTDREAAEAAGLNRSTVTKWRLYHPAFQAELEVQRQATWGAARERLRTLAMSAVDTLEDLMTSPGVEDADRIKVALGILKLTELGNGIGHRGETDVNEIVRKEAKGDPLISYCTPSDYEVESYEVRIQAVLNDTDEDVVWDVMDAQEKAKKAAERARKKTLKAAKAAEAGDTTAEVVHLMEGATDAMRAAGILTTEPRG